MVAREISFLGGFKSRFESTLAIDILFVQRGYFVQEAQEMLRGHFVHEAKQMLEWPFGPAKQETYGNISNMST